MNYHKGDHSSLCPWMLHKHRRIWCQRRWAHEQAPQPCISRQSWTQVSCRLSYGHTPHCYYRTATSSKEHNQLERVPLTLLSSHLRCTSSASLKQCKIQTINQTKKLHRHKVVLWICERERESRCEWEINLMGSSYFSTAGFAEIEKPKQRRNTVFPCVSLKEREENDRITEGLILRKRRGKEKWKAKKGNWRK